jgi:cytochrome c oxidase subunit 2
MAFDVVAMSRAEFDNWLTKLAEPVGEPELRALRQGRDLFVSLGCGICHTVRGLTESIIGPDLSRVGARHTLGAGTLPGGLEGLAKWIAYAQHLKPGNAMPSYHHLDAAQIRSLAAYLASLK